MGFLGKIKNILFEEDEDDVIPYYGNDDDETLKSEVKKEVKKEEEKKDEVQIEPIQVNQQSRFRNVKRDMDCSFDDEKDVLDDIKTEEVSTPRVEEVKEVVPEVAPKVEEPPKKEVFLSFDEDEFERLNSRINRNENKINRDVRRDAAKSTLSSARKANNNFSATSTVRDNDRLSGHTSSVSMSKKAFAPSPIISPVYGILDKNYTKDDIVEKKDGLKRERVKPIKKEVELSIEKEIKEEKIKNELPMMKAKNTMDIDSVRRKAYGVLEDEAEEYKNIKTIEEAEMEVENFTVKDSTDEDLRMFTDEMRRENTVTVQDVQDVQEEYDDVSTDESFDDVIDEGTSILDEIKSQIEDVEEQVDEDLENASTQHFDPVVREPYEEKPKKSKVLDDLEKTSTLQILDDIEKELSSIKPISKEYQDDGMDENESDETLEDDLFNLIDSMYEQREEDEIDD